VVSLKGCDAGPMGRWFREFVITDGGVVIRRLAVSDAN
jgi:hypothetical protein